jgi:hypothetical protein
MVDNVVPHPESCPRPESECCVNVHMRTALRTELKIIAAQRGITIQQLAYEALRTIAQEYRNTPEGRP